MSPIRPFEELDHPTQVERIERVARIALGAYGMAGEEITLLTHTVNSTFRVDVWPRTGGSLECYVLRVYRPEIYPENVVRSELRWLAALKQDENLGIPEPVPATNGSLVTTVSVDDIPGSRCCVLFRWVEGRFPDSTLTAEAVGRVGEFMARLHRYNERFAVPDFFERPRFGLDELIGESMVIPPGQGEALVSGRDPGTAPELAAGAWS